MKQLFHILQIKSKIYIKYLLSKKRQNLYNQYIGIKKCIIFLAADYGNLGDIAITYAQTKYLHSLFPNHTIINVPISRTISDLRAIKNICTEEDIISIIGGGNMGDLYYDIEILRQLVISKFPYNHVFSFPQTIIFSKSKTGYYMQHEAIRHYTSDNLLLMAREPVSFQNMSKLFSCNVILIPDIVMTLDASKPTQKRKGITLCLRNDDESFLDPNFMKELYVHLSDLGYSVSYYDTHIGRNNLTLEESKIELLKIWHHFRKSQWVITDRLHGMIFCFITKTPCLVLPNNNFKIEKSYDWIKECGYIYFINKKLDFENIANLLNLPTKDNFSFVHSKIINYYKQSFK